MPDIIRATERLMTMDDSVWARHANPWSVYAGMFTLPILALAIWSRDWMDWWAIIPVAITCLWIWYNPRAFNPPKSTDCWASKGTLGERIFLDRKKVSIPAHHERMAKILGTVSGMGVIAFIGGLWSLDIWITICGIIVMTGGKTWFVGRMVWLYEDMKGQLPECRQWLRK